MNIVFHGDNASATDAAQPDCLHRYQQDWQHPFNAESAVATQIFARGDVDVSSLLTGIFPLEKSLAAFTRVFDWARAMKVQLDQA